MNCQSLLPTVVTEADAFTYSGQRVMVEGWYRQEDIRMMQINPDKLFQGHAVLILEDDCRVFLYPPSAPESIRSEQEIRECEYKKVHVVGVIFPRIPQEGAVQIAPCLVEIQSIKPIHPHSNDQLTD